jgi:hypothetical protein
MLTKTVFSFLSSLIGGEVNQSTRGNLRGKIFDRFPNITKFWLQKYLKLVLKKTMSCDSLSK